MIELRIHGRGGQGAVLASLEIAQAAHRTGRHVQVFPEFGVERRGVPVTAFARVDEKPIRVRTKILNPDHVVVLDPALARTVPVTDGLKRGGSLVLNAPGAEALAPFRGRGFRLFWVDATSIAAKHKIGTTTAPIVNSTLVGAVARATGLYAPAGIGPSMDEVLGEKWPRNTAAALEAFEALREVEDGALTAVPAGAN
ncbi:MAG TPA: 2-oxoacid:acceptor oxidoreductase family protein [Planctomycetota bacterium]|nr:2-oxoacid:acceptor oxidoreductase family protein [Planctomycetota bacterium]